MKTIEPLLPNSNYDWSIVGLDISLTSTGITKIIGRIDYTDEIKTLAIASSPKDGDLYARSTRLLKGTLPYVDDKTLVFVEGYAFGTPAAKSQLATMAGIGHLIRYLIWKKTGIPPIEVTPGTLKKYACGKGNAKKDLVRLGTYKKWDKVEFKTDDEVDSFVLAKIGTDTFYGIKNISDDDYKTLQPVREFLLQLIAGKSVYHKLFY